jgi:hypothetical protein
MSLISTNVYGDLNLNGYVWRHFFDANVKSQSFGFTFSTDKGNYTFIPDDFIARGQVFNGIQYYSDKFLDKSVLDTMYTQYQPIDFGGFKDFNRADDFYEALELNGYGTSGVLVPESWTNQNFHNTGAMWHYTIGHQIGGVRLQAIQGMGEKDGQMVYVPSSYAVDGASNPSAWINPGGNNNLRVEYIPKLKWYQKIAREVAKVPLLPELAALGAAMAPGGAAYAPYVYAGLKGAALAGQGVDPLKAGLMVGISLAGQNLLGNTALARNIGASFGATTEAAQLAVGRVVLGAGVNGVQAVVTGGDVSKAMLNGAIAGGTTTAASFVSDALGKNAEGFLKSITDNTNLTRVQAQEIIAASVVGGLVAETRGGDFGDFFVSNLINAGVTQSTANAMRDKLPETMTPEMRAAITRGVSTVAGTAAEALARGQDVDDYLKVNLPNVLNSAMSAYNQERAAIQEGWASLEEKKRYQSLFGEGVKPDMALVRQLDPDFDLEAYKKLNNIATNEEAIEDYLSSGMVQGKATNFENYVTRLLSAVPEFDKDFYAEEFAAAINAAKTSSNPQQAVQTIANQINQSYTTTEEATQFFRDTFGRPPESESDLAFIQRYTGIPEVQAKEVLQTSKSTVDQSNQRRLETLAKARDSLENILRSEGYGDDDIALLYDAGVYDQLVDGLIQQQEQNIQQLQSRANAMASTFGSDSTEAKAAVRDLLQAQYDVGGYGVTKDGDNFVVAASTPGGALNHPGLIVYPDGSVVDLSQRGVDIDGVLTYDDGTTYSFGDAGDRAIVAALAIGESPNPPSDGGRSLFGTGTGSGEGPAFGFSFVGIDQKTGGSVYDSEDSGFSLIAYSDGKALAVNKLDPTQVIWVNPEVAKEVIDSKPVKTPEQIKKEFEEAERAKVAESVFTPGEVEKMLKDAGFKDPTEQQVGQFVGVSADPSKTKEAINKYIFDNTVSADEARQILESIGIQNPSQKDIERLTGQYPKSELEQKALEIKPDAQYNALVDAINRLQNQPVEELESSLRQAIADAQQAGLEGDAALRAAIDAVSNNLGTTRSELLARMGTTEAALRSDMASGLAGVSAETQAKYNALTAEQKALADALAKQGVDLNAAIKTAQEQAQQQITDVERSILDRVAAYEAAGMARDEALNLALGEASSQLGTTRDALLSSIGETEQRLTDQIAGVSQDVQAKYEALSAEQKALADALVQQGVNINSAIEAASKQAAEALAGTEQRLAGQINTVAELLGKPARQVTQSDIDYVNQMIGGGTGADLAYDINRDGKVDQADLDFMQGLIDGGGSGWTGQVGTVWGPTGLYGQQAQEAEATRQAQARASAAARSLQLKGQMRQGLASVMQQAPQAIQQSYRRIDPIYAQTRYANLNAPLFQSNLWGEQLAAQNATNQPNQFRMASGGYLDTQGDPQTWDDIYRMLK